jgi:hypothetical protein
MGLYAFSKRICGQLLGIDFAGLGVDDFAGECFLGHRFRSFAVAALGLLEPIAFAIHLKDVHMMGEPVEERSRL